MKKLKLFLFNKSKFILFIFLYTILFFASVHFIFYILPILLGGLLAAVMMPLCRVTEAKFSAPRRRTALCTVIVCYSLFLTAFVFLSVKLVRELHVFLASGEYFRFEALSPGAQSFFARVAAKLPQWLASAQKELSRNMQAALPALQGTLKAILFLPAAFLTLILTPIFAYYILLYRSNLFGFLQKLIGDKSAQNLRNAFKSNSATGFVSAYILIYFVTLAESFVILYLLRADYPLSTALVVTVSDIIPVLGPGSILLPLAAYRLLCDSVAQALGIFIGWIIISVIRQIIEPKLLAKTTRTPSIVMLFAVYCSLIGHNFWLIPYVGILFSLLHILQKAEILPDNQKAKFE